MKWHVPNLLTMIGVALTTVHCGSASAPETDGNSPVDDGIRTKQEALNGTGDFKIGLTVYKTGPGGRPNTTSMTLFTAISATSAATETPVWTPWNTTSDPDLTGISVSLMPFNLGNANGFFPWMDFKIGIQARDDVAGATIGTEHWTPWASDLGAVSTTARRQTDDSGDTPATSSAGDFHPEFYRVGFQIRPWPKPKRTLLDFTIGVMGYGYLNDAAVFPSFGPFNWTRAFSQGGGMSPVAVGPGDPDHGWSDPRYFQRGMALLLSVVYQDSP